MLLFRRMSSDHTERSCSKPSHVYSWRSRVLTASFLTSEDEKQDSATEMTQERLGELLRASLDDLCRRAELAVREGVSLVIVSDRCVCRNRVPVPSLLAVGAVHQHLLRQNLRMRCGLLVESGDAR